MTIAPREERALLGIGLMLFAFFCFTGIDACAKWLILAGVPAMEVVFVRYVVHVIIMSAIALPMIGIELFRTSAPWSEGLRALCLLGSTLLNFTAVKYLPLTLTATIMFTTPLWICALSVPFLGEKVGIRRWSAIGVGFCGILVAVRPWEAEAHWAALLSLTAALFVACYTILTRRLAGIDSTATQQFYAAMLATLIIAPFAFGEWRWPEGVGWVAFCLVGFFGWLGHHALTIAHRYAPPATLAPFIYVQLIYMTAASWAIFAQPPTGWMIAGACIVLASGLFIWLRERKLAQGPA